MGSSTGTRRIFIRRDDVVSTVDGTDDTAPGGELLLAIANLSWPKEGVDKG
jgi:hypothetical protein